MASQSEVGHARNVANLQKLIQQITAYTLYNPPVPALQIANLQTLHTNSVAKLAELEDSRIANKAAIYNRQVAFENLKPLSTRIFNFLEIIDLPAGMLEQARSLNRIIQGYTPRTQQPENPDPDGEPKDTVSTSRQSYTQQAETFGNLVSLLQTIPAYTPNEDDLKLPALTTYHQALVTATQPVDQTEAELKVQLIARDQLLYAEGTGLIDLAQKVKKYVKSIYGGDSPEYTNVAAIKFTDPKR